MRRKTAWIFAVSCALMLPPAASAQSPQPPSTPSAQPAAPVTGNLPADFYVKPGCERPEKPSLPKPGFGDQSGIATYNATARRYNNASKTFSACINAYADKARNDIDWITFMANAAVAKANGTAAPSPPALASNMPAGFYPSPDCILPDKQLGATPNRRDAKAMDTYDTKVRTFNVLATDFNGCVKDYVARAKVDIERVEHAQRDAALEAGGQVAPAVAASAQVPPVPAQAPPLPTENVTVTAARSREALDKFAKAFATPTTLTGKIARWETAICPSVVGQKPAFTAFIAERVKAIAAASGAPVNTDPSCTPNIQVVFTTTPQALLDQVRNDDPDYLGYATTSEQREKLATVTRPIQAWYTTETIDLDGMHRMDSGRKLGNGITLPNFTAFAMPGSVANRAPIYLPDATYARVTGNRINDGVRTGLNHVIVVVDTNKLAGQRMVPLSDYIAMLALTQLNSLDACQELPSIVNLMAANCGQNVDGITATDLAYLRALYRMGADKSRVFQQDDIADAMMTEMQGK